MMILSLRRKGEPMRILVALIPLMAAIGCGSSSDTNGPGEKACQDLAAKYASCNLTTQGICNTAQPCVVECAAKADCSQLTLAPSGSEYFVPKWKI